MSTALCVCAHRAIGGLSDDLVHVCVHTCTCVLTLLPPPGPQLQCVGVVVCAISGLPNDSVQWVYVRAVVHSHTPCPGLIELPRLGPPLLARAFVCGWVQLRMHMCDCVDAWCNTKQHWQYTTTTTTTATMHASSPPPRPLPLPPPHTHSSPQVTLYVHELVVSHEGNHPTPYARSLHLRAHTQ